MARRMPFMNLGLLSGAGLSEIPMTLPGLIQPALEEVGAQEDPELGIEGLTAEWVAQHAWQIDAEVSLEGWSDQRAFVELWGICGRGSLWIEGREAAAFSGGNLTIEVTEYIEPEREVLQVQLHFLPAPPEESAPQAVGIEGGLWLRGISYLAIQLLQVKPELRGGQLQLTASVEAFEAGVYDFAYALMQGDEVISQQRVEEELPVGQGVRRHSIRVRAPALWRIGAENTLYTLRLAITRKGVGCDRTQQRVGFRTLGIERSPVEGREYLSEINARRVMLRGAAWRRADSKQEIERLLTLLLEGHYNCLQVRQVESEAFYDACDRRGVLVWQELPSEPEEARMVVARLGYHASIVLWSLPPLSGADGRPAAPDDPRVEAVRRLLRDLGDERPFLGPSPGGPVTRATIEELGRGMCFSVEGPDVYQGAEWLARYFELDDALIRHMAPVATVRAGRMLELSGGRSPWPPGGGGWARRGGQPPVLDRLDALDWLGQDVTQDVMQMARLSRYWQAQMLRYAAQRARARQSAGFFAGDFREPFPALGSPALIEHDGATRPAYHAVASAFAPIALSARLDRLAFWAGTHADVFVELQVAEDAADPAVPITLTCECFTHGGERFFHRRWQSPLAPVQLPVQRIQMPDFPGVVLLRLEALQGAKTLCREDLTLCVGLRALESALISPPVTMLTIEEGFLLNAGESLAFGLCCDGYEEPWMPGWGALLPGEFHPIREGAAIEGHNIQLLPALTIEGGREGGMNR